ncbi:lytic transglycosylase domain-containing protein [Aquifex sp.]
MRGVVLLLILFVTAFSQELVEKYELYRIFLDTKDVQLGKRLLERYPDAPFRNELIIRLVELTYRKKPSEARRLLKKVNLKRIPPSRQKEVIRIWRRLGLSLKPLVLAYPEKFLPYVTRYRFSQEEREKIAKRLFYRKKYEYVIKLSQNCYYVGVSYYRLGKLNRAEKILKNCELNRAKRYLIYLYLRKGMFIKAENFVEELADPYFYYLLGREYLERENYIKAREFLSKSTYPEAKFYLGLLNYIERNYEEAKKNFEEYSPLKDIDRAKKFFWLFKTSLALRKPEEALSNLLKASAYENFYSAVAKLYLNRKVFIPAVKTSVEKPKLFFQLKEISELGFPYYMRVEAFRNMKNLTSGDILLLKDYDPYLSIRLAVNKYGVDSDIYKLVAYPTPFRGIVKQVSKRFDVSEALIYAVMRQESLFNVYAVSPSGAMGLMQLMDFTARWKAKRLGIEARDVFDVHTNITLGAAYLRYLLDYWDGDLVRAVASYNAGPGAVSKWKDYGDDYIFIELIPYRETRKYVKKVLYNYYVYRELLK